MLQKSPMYAYIPATDVEDYDLPGMKTRDHIFTGGGAKAAWFKDSEGNTLAVIQDL